MKSTTWCYFSPQRRILPKSQWLHWTSLPNARLSSLLHTKHLLNSFLSRAIVRYLIILFPTNLLPIRHSTLRRPGQVSGCRAYIGRTLNTAEPHLFLTAASTAISLLLRSGSREVVYCGLISSNPSLGEVWDFTLLPPPPLRGGKDGDQAPRFAQHCSTGRAAPPPPRHSTKSTHRISRSRRARKAPSSMQLIWLLSSCLQKGRERMKAGWYGQNCLGAPGRGLPRHRGVPPPPRSACSPPGAGLLGCHAALALLAAVWQRCTLPHTEACQVSVNINCAFFFFFFLKAEGSNFITLGHPIHYELLPSCHWNNFIKLKACKSLEVTVLPSVTSQNAFFLLLEVGVLCPDSTKSPGFICPRAVRVHREYTNSKLDSTNLIL